MVSSAHFASCLDADLDALFLLDEVERDLPEDGHVLGRVDRGGSVSGLRRRPYRGPSEGCSRWTNASELSGPYLGYL